MSYRYKRRRFKRPYRKRSYGTKKRVTKLQKMANDTGAARWTAGNVASAAFTALKIANGLKGLVNSEWKNHDVDTNFSQGDTPSLTRLTAIAQGDTEGARDGDSILMKKLTICERGVINSSSTSSVVIRRAIVCDTRCDGADPSYTDIYQNSDLTTLLNNDQDGRFVILKDDVYCLSSNGIRDYYNKFTLPLNIHCRYDDTVSTIGAAKGNQLYYIIWSNDDTNQPAVDFHSRLRFTDN